MITNKLKTAIYALLLMLFMSPNLKATEECLDNYDCIYIARLISVCFYLLICNWFVNSKRFIDRPCDLAWKEARGA